MTRIREPLVSSNHLQSKAIQKRNHQRINNTLTLDDDYFYFLFS
jgi:hypothetical protein